jgi:hypothetical protein
MCKFSVNFEIAVESEEVELWHRRIRRELKLSRRQGAKRFKKPNAHAVLGQKTYLTKF